MLKRLRNKKKPILGAVAWAVAYVVCRFLLDMGDPEAEIAATTVSVFVVERVGPIFGVDVKTPKIEPDRIGTGEQVVVEKDGEKEKLGRPNQR